MVKNLPVNAGDIKRLGFHPWVRKIPWRRAWQPLLVFLPEESQGQRILSMEATVHRVAMSQTHGSDLAHMPSFISPGPRDRLIRILN